jgi:hypothetical protein
MRAPPTADTPRSAVDLASPRSGRGRRLRRLVGHRRTTPGRLHLIRVALVLVGLVSGAVGAWSAWDRIDTISDIKTRNEPLSAHAAEIYRSLADADATAASGFLLSGLEPPAGRERYKQDISQAADTLAHASSQIGGSNSAADPIVKIATQLPVYTGLIETARANDRQGWPVSGAYLRRASQLMQETILPAAEELHRIQSGELDAKYAQARSVPVPALLGGLVSLAALAYAQVFLCHRTNRILNVGLVAATTIVVIVTVWWGVAAGLAKHHLADARRHSEVVTDALGQAQIAMLKARSDESLALVGRSGGGAYERDFTAQAARLDQVLSQAPGFMGRANVEAATQAWLTAHRQVRALDDSGQYPQAIAFAVSDDPMGPSATFARLDRALADAISDERREFTIAVDRGRRVLSGLHIGTGLFTLLAAVGAAWGIGRRLEEYR